MDTEIKIRRMFRHKWFKFKNGATKPVKQECNETSFSFKRLFGLTCSELCRNCLSGTIPMEWASLPYLTNIDKTFRSLEANRFSGPIPDELGNLTSLTRLLLGSNQFTGNLPSTLARLVNLTDFRLSDNNFNGTIPGYIGNWTGLKKLHLFASGLKGPIPDTVARLGSLTELSITDTTGIITCPNLSSQVIKKLYLDSSDMFLVLRLDSV
ncbi:hypothetical protein YC2023_083198 [Brassica napus]